ncbi:MAG: Tm-1-like ATP-binding domain-containing protein [Microbacteriaceae bacterium]|nr:Tm-1-like ATP-binding domain-containing protein [Microbacteriaceae bacterium]
MSLPTQDRPTVLLIGALDTKGPEHAYVRDRLVEAGVAVILADFGILGEPGVSPDVPAEAIAERAGQTLLELRANRDVHGARAAAMEVMSSGAVSLARELASQGRIHGILGLGGGEGSTVISAAMRALPFGFPKLLVSTMTPTNVGAYFGGKDLTLVHSVTDIAGINRVSKRTLDNAAAMGAGMVLFAVKDEPDEGARRPLVALSMFGTTTRGADEIRRLLDGAGFESVVFHAVGSGGAAMEEMIDAGLIDGVIDLTPSELTDELFEGIFSAGPHRLEAAGTKGIPQVIVPGAMGQITFGAAETVPAKFRAEGRKILVHSPSVTIVRADASESRMIADVLAEKILHSSGPVAVALPLGGLSDYEQTGAPLADHDSDEALFSTLIARLHDRVPIVQDAADINSERFAALVFELFMDVWRKGFAGSATRGGDKLRPELTKEKEW